MPFWNAVGHTESNIQYIFPADDFEIMSFHTSIFTVCLFTMQELIKEQNSVKHNSAFKEHICTEGQRNGKDWKSDSIYVYFNFP